MKTCANVETTLPLIQATNTNYALMSSCGLEVNHSRFVTHGFQNK